MNLEIDKSGSVKKIIGLVWSGKTLTVEFVNASSYFINKIGYITEQIVTVPGVAGTLAEALKLSYSVAHALGEGPEGSGPDQVKNLSAEINNRFVLCFLDTAINMFDLIEFFNDGVRYVNEGGPQLSEIGDTSGLPTRMNPTPRTLALVKQPLPPPILDDISTR